MRHAALAGEAQDRLRVLPRLFRSGTPRKHKPARIRFTSRSDRFTTPSRSWSANPFLAMLVPGAGVD